MYNKDTVKDTEGVKMYNKKEIMVAAWRLYKNSLETRFPKSFSDCLKRSWELAKCKAAAKKLADDRKASKESALKAAGAFKNGMEIVVSGYSFTLNRWTNGNLDRVYINGGRSDGYGYIDIAKMQYCPKTNFDPAKSTATIVMTMQF